MTIRRNWVMAFYKEEVNMINKDVLQKFDKCNIAVFGDLMLDKYIFGAVERISPEAPIPIVKVEREQFTPGGAANVAANISTLGGMSHLFGIIGDDTAGKLFQNICGKYRIKMDGILTDKKKRTIEKTRIIAQNQQLLRIDSEDGNYVENQKRDVFQSKLQILSDISAFVVSDYAKGTITRALLEDLKAQSKKMGIPLIIDPKPCHKAFYHDVTLITPNQKEAGEMCHQVIRSQTDREKCGIELAKKLNCNVIITAGDHGMSVFEHDQNVQVVHIPTATQEVYDVSGAGDTVVAALALALSIGLNLYQAAELANIAAGIKVGKLGTAPVHAEEIKKKLEK